MATVSTVAKRKTLFDDRPVEINELTYVIKQDLSSLNAQISSLQSMTRSQNSKSGAEQEGEHNKNVKGSFVAQDGVQLMDALLGCCTSSRQAGRRRR